MVQPQWGRVSPRTQDPKPNPHSQHDASVALTSMVLSAPLVGSYTATCSAAVEAMLTPHVSQLVALAGGFQPVLYSPSPQGRVAPSTVLKPGGVTAAVASGRTTTRHDADWVLVVL